MASDVIKPIEVQIEGDQIIILWDDGHRGIYPHRLLRLRCRCANCVEEMTGRKLLNVNSIPEDIFIVDYLVIGNYAYQFLWSNADPCSTTGIYTYELLELLGKNDKAVKKV